MKGIRKEMIVADPSRISPKEAYEKVKAGKILLVCAYEDDERYQQMQLEGGISFKDFQAKLPALSKDQEIAFYCA